MIGGLFQSKINHNDNDQLQDNDDEIIHDFPIVEIFSDTKTLVQDDMNSVKDNFIVAHLY